jgi:glycosyltransferase involved in cell wall biosynthesis
MPSERAPFRLVHVMTVPLSLGFFRGQVGYMKGLGFEVHMITSPGEALQRFSEQEQVAVHAVTMSRRIAPFKDLVALVRLCRALSQIKPHIVHAHTPKGGLLGSLAAYMTGVPVRIYHIRGLPFMTAKGLKRLILRLSERVACLLAGRVLCVSHSIREIAIAERLCPPAKIKVLRNGSGNGVDAVSRFNPARADSQLRGQVRAQIGIPADALVIGFVGRIVRDKGIMELAEAWSRLRDEFNSLFLLLVGPLEPQDPLPEKVVQLLRSDPRVRLVDFAADIFPFYTAMDVVTLPSYREGFPNVPLEAAAMQLPIVATRIPGCTDAIQDGSTGMLIPPYDAGALTTALRAYLNNPELRRRHGRAAREYVLANFRPQDIWEALYHEYEELLAQHGYRAS